MNKRTHNHKFGTQKPLQKSHVKTHLQEILFNSPVMKYFFWGGGNTGNIVMTFSITFACILLYNRVKNLNSL